MTLQPEGAGKAGCALHPRSRVQNVHKNTHTSIQVQRRHSGIPCAMVLTAYSALSPAIRPWVVTVIGGSYRQLDASLEASGPHTFAVRIRAESSIGASASIAPRSAFVTIASRPSEWNGMTGI